MPCSVLSFKRSVMINHMTDWSRDFLLHAQLCEPFKEVLDQMSKHDPTASLFSSLKKIVSHHMDVT